MFGMYGFGAGYFADGPNLSGTPISPFVGPAEIILVDGTFRRTVTVDAAVRRVVRVDVTFRRRIDLEIER